MGMNYDRPRLVFQKVDYHPLNLKYGNAYYPGCFTSTGLTSDNPDYHKMLEWCEKNMCGKKHEYMQDHLVFESEQEVVWFLLHWG